MQIKYIALGIAALAFAVQAQDDGVEVEGTVEVGESFDDSFDDSFDEEVDFGSDEFNEDGGYEGAPPEQPTLTPVSMKIWIMEE